MTSEVPLLCRGLGSSSSVIGRVELTNQLGKIILSDEDTKLEIATKIEGHPDNVALAKAILEIWYVAGYVDQQTNHLSPSLPR